MKSFVYILQCSDGSFYTGYTVNLEKRLNKHNSGTASKYTRGRLPVKFVYTVECESKGQALSLEHRIKKLTREQKEKLIKGQLVLD